MAAIEAHSESEIDLHKHLSFVWYKTHAMDTAR